ncbi:MAG: hypothetical protein V1806_11895 [Pseudomonadota bacterium]
MSEQIISRVSRIVEWHRSQLNVNNPSVLAVPQKDQWKAWDDNKLWCTFFFSVISPGGSINARKYLRLIESGELAFELNPSKLSEMTDEQRIEEIWSLGVGNNYINTRLARFFSKPGKKYVENSLQSNLNDTFLQLKNRGFIAWFVEINKISDERSKAMELEFLPGSKFKVSRDFLNNVGMTETLIPLDVHILGEMIDNWGWDVPKHTPPVRCKYEEIEDAVREIAEKVHCKVVEIDKAIVSWRISQRH